MTEISCDICLDLMPLVQDGIASEDSCQAVEQHIQHCESCRALYQAPPTPPAKADSILPQLRRSLRLAEGSVLLLGLLVGTSLSASAAQFYNVLLMPAVGIISYLIFRWKALYTVPVLLFLTHFPVSLISSILQGDQPHWYSTLMYTLFYCLFALLGILIAGLFHFAFRKERSR